jgi:Glycosyltransferase family 87
MVLKGKAVQEAIIYLSVFVISLLGFYYLVIDGVDYYFTYYSITQNWLGGRSILFDEMSRGLFNPPWLIWLTTPFVLLPYQFGLSVLRAVTMVVLVYGIMTLTEQIKGYPRLLALAFGIFNFHILDLIVRGQIDAFAVLGAVLGLRSKNWVTMGLAITLLAVKPPNTIPLIIYFLIITRRESGLVESLKSLIIPAGVFLLSIFMHGFWFLRWLDNYKSLEPFDTWKVTIWRAAEVLKLPVFVPILFVLIVLAVAFWLWRFARTKEAQVALIISTTFMVTIYALSYHYILIFAIIFPLLVSWRWWIGVLLYLLTFLPLVRLYTGANHSYIDLLFVTAVFISTAFWLVKAKPAF